jgi:fructose-bisphosphate aldolase class 1
MLCRAVCCLQVVGSSARSAATQLLHKVVQRQVLADWRLAVRADRALKQDVLRAWSAWVQEHQVR